MEQVQLRNDFLLRVISFNLKRDGFFGEKNRWAKREQVAMEAIVHSGASIIGVQELLPGMKRDVAEQMMDYSIFGYGRYLGRNHYNDEHSDIIVRDQDAEVKRHKTFWLSKRPEKVASRGTLALFPRICTVAEVYVKELGCFVRVFNTHLDCVSPLARTLGVRIILEYMDRYNRQQQMPTILMGDMNAKPNSKAIRILRENLHNYESIHLNDAYEVLNGGKIYNTYHNFKGQVVEKKQPIDYIFVSDEFEVVRSEILAQCGENGQYPSDHFPVMATLRLRKPVRA